MEIKTDDRFCIIVIIKEMIVEWDLMGGNFLKCSFAGMRFNPKIM
jgi:hypothetical protein